MRIAIAVVASVTAALVPVGAQPQSSAATLTPASPSGGKSLGTERAPGADAAAKRERGRLRIRLANVPAAATPRVRVKGPADYRRTVLRTTTLRKLRPGTYVIRALKTPAGVSASPRRKVVEVQPGRTKRVVIRYGGRQAGLPKPVTRIVAPAETTTVSAGRGYAIRIPAGTLQRRSRVTVTPKAAGDGLPTADFRIAGPWRGAVAVTMPQSDPDGGAWPVLIRKTAAGDRLSSGTGVRTGTSGGVATVTAKLSSPSQDAGQVEAEVAQLQAAATLQVKSWDEAICASMSPRDRSRRFVCNNNGGALFQPWFLEQAMLGADRLRSRGIGTAPCGARRGTAQATGSLPLGVSCTVDFVIPTTSAAFRFRNDASVDVGGLYSSGAVFRHSTVGGAATATVVVPGDVSLLLQPIARAGARVYLAPGGALKVVKPLGSVPSTVDVQGDLAATAVYQGIDLLIGQLGDALIEMGAADAAMNAEFLRCATGKMDKTVANCVGSAVSHLVGVAADAGATSKWARVRGGAKVLKGVLKSVSLVSFVDSMVMAASGWKPAAKVTVSNGTANVSMAPLTFDEYDQWGEATISNQYAARGVVFDNVPYPMLSEDGANPTTPVLSGSPRFTGPIQFRFVRNGAPAVTNRVSFDVGYLNVVGSIRISWYAVDGRLLGSRNTTAIGIQHILLDQAGIHRVRVEDQVGDGEPAGFAIDNLGTGTGARAAAAQQRPGATEQGQGADVEGPSTKSGDRAQ